MSSKEIYVNDIGVVNLIKSRKAKRISIRIAPNKGVRVSIPYYESYKRAIAFVEHKHNWIVKSREKMSAIESGNRIAIDSSLDTLYHTFFFTIVQNSTLKSKIEGEKILVYIPENLVSQNSFLLEDISEAFIPILKLEAKRYLPNRTAEIAEHFGYQYKRLTLRQNKSRWGSCSHDNNISLNIHLMRLPIFLIDYVILHELVHTKIKNHSAKFWSQLQTFMPDARERAKLVRKSGVQLF